MFTDERKQSQMNPHYSFYFALQSRSTGDVEHAQRVRRLETAAEDPEFSCHIEVHGDVTTLQIETQSTSRAVAFKLESECALAEEHSQRHGVV
jgi:hypothetical protein